MSTDIKEVVKEKYGQAALRVHSGGSSCCGASAALNSCCDPIATNLYDAAQASQIPEDALKAPLGCGNPTALAQLNAGETYSISVPAGASTCCFLPNASGLQGKRTVSI